MIPALKSLRQGLSMPPSGWTLAGLLAFYVLAGLFGHDPWKNEDAIHIGIAYDILSEGHWLTPELAGRTAYKPPLYYWSAALFGDWLGGWLPLHSALRMASGLWMSFSLLGLYYAGREFYGRSAAAASPLLMVGAVGLIVDAHEAQPLLVGVAAYSVALAALAVLPRRPWLASSYYALSVTACLLGVGVAASVPLVLLGPLALLLLPHPSKLPQSPRLTRRWHLVLLVALALVLGAGVAALWPWQLQAHAPAYYAHWQQLEWLQFSASKQPGQEFLAYLAMLPWFAWPVLPVAVWSLWLRRRLLNDFSLLLPLVLFVGTLVLLAFAYPSQPLPGILLLPPLALLATPGILSLRRGAANALDWFSRATFSFFALLVWAGWLAMVWHWPAQLAERVVTLEPGFSGHFRPLAFVIAVVVSLWWAWLVTTLPKSPYRGLTLWSAGFTTLWLLLISLWLPWIDYGKSYRLVSQSLAAQLPPEPGCVAERSVGDAQRASFAYFARLHLQPFDKADQDECRWLLVQGESRIELAPPASKGWKKVWEGNRQGERKEKFRLYRRDPAGRDESSELAEPAGDKTGRNTGSNKAPRGVKQTGKP